MNKASSTGPCICCYLFSETLSLPQTQGSHRALELWRQEGYCSRPQDTLLVHKFALHSPLMEKERRKPSLSLLNVSIKDHLTHGETCCSRTAISLVTVLSLQKNLLLSCCLYPAGQGEFPGPICQTQSFVLHLPGGGEPRESGLSFQEECPPEEAHIDNTMPGLSPRAKGMR